MIGLIRMGNLCIRDTLRGILQYDSCMEINNRLNLGRLSSNNFFEGVNRIRFRSTIMVLIFLWVFGKKIAENLYHICDLFQNLTVFSKSQIWAET